MYSLLLRLACLTAFVVMANANALAQQDSSFEAEVKQILISHDAEILRNIEAAKSKIAEAEADLLRRLDATARRAIAKGDIAGASASYKEVLRRKPKDTPAKAFFGTLKTLDAVMIEIETEAKKDAAADPKDPNPPNQANAEDQDGEKQPDIWELLGIREGKVRATQQAAPWKDLKPAKIKVQGGGYDLKPVRKGQQMFSNRNFYEWKKVPPEVDGWLFTFAPVGQFPNYKIKVSESGTVYCLASVEMFNPSEIQGALKFYEQGWIPRTLVLSEFTPYMVFSREGNAGEVVELPHNHTFTFTMIVHPGDLIER